jgi:GrpB-like predicted nucleotidyltransferase (UPF0157 family)
MMLEEDAPIRLAAYDPQWVRLFNEECEKLRGVLRPWLAGPIEHIGSTAVPGMLAKPIIDVMAPVSTLERSKDAIIAVRVLDYAYAPYHADAMHWFCKPRPSFRTHHLHLVPYESALWNERIAFRDRLCEDKDAAAEYSELKRSLFASFEHDREAYTDGKSEFVARIIKESLEKKAFRLT